jgi:hypothetical protein
MANHNFNFKDSYTEGEVWKAVDDGFDVRHEIWKKQYPDISSLLIILIRCGGTEMYPSLGL